MRSLILLAALFACVVVSVRVNSCKPQEPDPEREEFRHLRNKTFACLMYLIDKNKDDKIDHQEFENFRHNKLRIYERPLAVWSVVLNWCNCDNDPATLSWDDIDGSEKDCLHNELLVKQAYNRLCAKLDEKDFADELDSNADEVWDNEE